jgi:acyl-homoserine-lactone acylase
MIAERVAGTDHLGPAKFTISTLQRMWESDRSRLAELVLAPLVSDCRAHPSAVASNGKTVGLALACKALAGYNRTGAENAKGGWLFSEWNNNYTKGTFWANPFNPRAPLTSPSGLNIANPVDQAPYGEVYDGSSLVMTTELNPSGPTSQGILAYSQATDPTSARYANMTRLYSSRSWVTLAYTQAQLNAEHPPVTLTLSVR